MHVRLIGYWRSTADDARPENDRWPDPHDLIDESWDDRQRERVAAYLEQGFVPWVFRGYSPCRLCGRANGYGELTDGVYLWPEGLAHYVRDHSVRLPADVLAHIERRQVELESLEVDHDWWLSAIFSRDARG